MNLNPARSPTADPSSLEPTSEVRLRSAPPPAFKSRPSDECPERELDGLCQFAREHGGVVRPVFVDGIFFGYRPDVPRG